jgi:cell division protein FtsB
VTQGGIKERMHAARTGYRQEQDAEFGRLKQEVATLKQEIERLKKLLSQNEIEY